jgi:hypothetical protein
MMYFKEETGFNGAVVPSMIRDKLLGGAIK